MLGKRTIVLLIAGSLVWLAALMWLLGSLGNEPVSFVDKPHEASGTSSTPGATTDAAVSAAATPDSGNRIVDHGDEGASTTVASHEADIEVPLVDGAVTSAGTGNSTVNTDNSVALDESASDDLVPDSSASAVGALSAVSDDLLDAAMASESVELTNGLSPQVSMFSADAAGVVAGVANVASDSGTETEPDTQITEAPDTTITVDTDAIDNKQATQSPPVDDDTFRQLMSQGQQIYNKYCALCHQEDGLGLGAFPAITGSAVATGPSADHINLVFNGVAGTGMRGFADQLTDQDIAAVVTYQRNALGNSTGDAVATETIAAVREATAVKE